MRQGKFFILQFVQVETAYVTAAIELCAAGI